MITTYRVSRLDDAHMTIAINRPGDGDAWPSISISFDTVEPLIEALRLVRSGAECSEGEQTTEAPSA